MPGILEIHLKRECSFLVMMLRSQGRGGLGSYLNSFSFTLARRQALEPVSPSQTISRATLIYLHITCLSIFQHSPELSFHSLVGGTGEVKAPGSSRGDLHGEDPRYCPEPRVFSLLLFRVFSVVFLLF